ncbi:MAG: diguanylate cyclase [Pseudomonadota bacterium]
MTMSISRQLLLSAFILALGVFFARQAGELQIERALTQQRADALLTLTAHRARLESVLNSSLHLTSGLASLIAVEGGLDEERFQLLARDLLGLNPHLRNIALAPDNVIRMVYPLARNEKALGLAYRDVPEQWPAVERAMTIRKAVVAGPLQLRQGGLGIIHRIPVFLARGPDEGEYWGVVSSVIDFDTLLEASGLSKDAHPGFELALRGQSEDGAAPRMIWGMPRVFEGEYMALEVRLPDASWWLGVRPPQGWGAPPVWRTKTFLLGVLLSVLISGLVLLLLRKQSSITRLALHDELTGLLNRRAFDLRLREAVARQARHAGSFAVLHLDLDGFKPINDRFGHAAGDQALCILSERLHNCLRMDDVLARFGGDEFVILVQSPGSSAMRMAERVADKAVQALSQPMVLSGATVSCGVSIGIAACPELACDETGLMHYADQAMYAAKSAGKGCWRVWKMEADGPRQGAAH